ncbi:MAG: serine/threonine-protein kinase [Myxococcota bacterium]
MSRVETFAEGRGLELGERVGNYEIVRLLGVGALGVVYEAQDLERRAPVALKTLRSAGFAQVGWLKSEFRAAAALTHRNLVTLYELVEEPPHVFYAMELVEGADFVADARAGGFDRLRATLAEVMEGVDALHARGLVHRDLKPQNVLVTPEGRVVLLDFDLLAALDEPDGAGIAGTLAYLAPEVLAGARAEPASDLYAAGVMMYEALTGGLPWGTGRLLDPARFTEVPRPSSRARDLPADLEGICVGLLVLVPETPPRAFRKICPLRARHPRTACRPERGAACGRSARP